MTTDTTAHAISDLKDLLGNRLSPGGSILAATCSFDTVDDAVNSVIMAIQMGIPMARIELLDEVQMQGMNIFNPDLNLPEKPHLFLEFHGSDAGGERPGGSVREHRRRIRCVGPSVGHQGGRSYLLSTVFKRRY